MRDCEAIEIRALEKSKSKVDRKEKIREVDRQILKHTKKLSPRWQSKVRKERSKNTITQSCLPRTEFSSLEAV